MKVKIDESLCVGCCLCQNICPNIFTKNNDSKIVVKNGQISKNDEKKIEEAVESCPVKAIKIKK